MYFFPRCSWLFWIILISSGTSTRKIITATQNTITAKNHQRAVEEDPKLLQKIHVPPSLRFLSSSSNVVKNVVLTTATGSTDNTNKKTCDKQFMTCLEHSKCTQCFKDMESSNLDWSILNIYSNDGNSNTSCHDILDTLIHKGNICTSYLVAENHRGSMDGTTAQQEEQEREIFCNTLDSCVIWKTNPDDKTNNDNTDDDHSSNTSIDCNALTTCDFPGMKSSYIGDGICHEFIHGCYNTAICNYDGGDCCPDTCQNKTDLIGCGSDGYACRDPKSLICTLGSNCSKDANGGGSTPSSVKPPNCTQENTIPFRMYQYDSFGDGWDRTTMTIRDTSSQNLVYSGKLDDGYEEMKYICISSTPACYNVILEGGFWGNEVSWKIHPLKNGAPEIASGGAPMDCTFPVAGGIQGCELTCNGRKNVDPEQDEKYQGYHKMVNCIEQKCLIQVEACKRDYVCNSCLSDNSYAYCLASDVYNALVFCTECNCVEDIDPEEKRRFCEKKSREKNENFSDFDDVFDDDSSSGILRSCSFEDFMSGTDAVIQYSECSGVDAMMSLITNFDPDNFGMLDAFEKCATEYTASKHTKSALDCFRILEKAIDNPSVDSKKNAPLAAISALANDLLHDGQHFCDCTVAASTNTPVCKDFIHFKTLLYESVDGCRALDAVDCDAWAEYYKPCQSNLIQKYRKVDFRETRQCDFVHDTMCGNVGPFPSFRQLNCGNEISEAAWTFYTDFQRNCLKSNPSPTPTKPSTPSVPDNIPKKPTAPPPNPWDIKPEERKKYIPPEKRGKKTTHTFRNFILLSAVLYGGYWWYKNHYHYGFGSTMSGYYNQFRIRRARPNFDYESDAMYDSLVLENVGPSSPSSSSFVPPTLPPDSTAYQLPIGLSPPPENNGNYPGRV